MPGLRYCDDGVMLRHKAGRWSEERTQSPGRNEAATASTLVTPTTVTRKALSSPATSLAEAQCRHLAVLLSRLHPGIGQVQVLRVLEYNSRQAVILFHGPQ